MDSSKNFVKFENVQNIVACSFPVFFLKKNTYCFLQVSSLTQFFLNHQDNKLSRLLAVILDAKIHGTISKF